MDTTANSDKLDAKPVSAEEAAQAAIKLITNGTKALLDISERNDLDAKTKVLCAFQLQNAMKDMRYMNTQFNKSVAEGMKDKMAILTGDDGRNYSVEKVNKAVRKDIDREGLVEAVDRLSHDNKHRVNTRTGELDDVSTTRTRLYKLCFRFEPRWTQLKEVGIDDDEYCIKSWEKTAKINSGGSL